MIISSFILVFVLEEGAQAGKEVERKNEEEKGKKRKEPIKR